MNKKLLLVLPAAMLLMGASCASKVGLNTSTNTSVTPAQPAQPANQIQQPATPAEPATPAQPNALVTVNTSTDAKLGAHLVASNGMTLYTKSSDTLGVSTCTGSCATLWPPYTVSVGTALSGSGAVKGVLATYTRTDGTLQVTYKGMPLYFYTSDAKPGDVSGQAVGGVWFVAKP